LGTIPGPSRLLGRATTLDIKIGDLDMTIKSKLNGTEKFWSVFYELEDALGDEVSFEELSQATKTLLNVSKKEYVEKTYRDTKERANYYTRDTDRMIENDHCLALRNEYTGYDTAPQK
jgi:hypothetical protein